MASFNRVILLGNMTRDVELRHIPSGMAVTDIGMAVNDRRKNTNGEWVEETTFVDITLWGRTAEIASEYLTKGAPVLIEGRLKLDTWEAEGQKRSKLKVIGERMQLLSGGKGGDGGGGSRGDSGSSSGSYSRSTSASTTGRAAPASSHQQDYYDVPPDDDVPF